MQSSQAPQFGALSEYGNRLGDAAFWAPYAREALSRHGFDVDDRQLESGFVGTYPTFLTGDVVVKLFGHFPSWRSDHATELEVQRILLAHKEIPAPALLADGALYGTGEPWPYLITERLSGAAIRESRPEPNVARRVAYDLGAVMRDVHEVVVPSGFDRDWLAEHREDATARHREWGLLPAGLLDRLDAYLRTHLPDGGERKLVHGDLTADHVFVDGGRLAGVIDWGDAQYTDPHYDLPAIYLDAFRGDSGLLRAFLDGYGWPVDGFPHRLLSAVLLHQFADGELGAIGKLVPLGEVADLEELAIRLYPLITR